MQYRLLLAGMGSFPERLFMMMMTTTMMMVVVELYCLPACLPVCLSVCL